MLNFVSKAFWENQMWFEEEREFLIILNWTGKSTQIITSENWPGKGDAVENKERVDEL